MLYLALLGGLGFLSLPIKYDRIISWLMLFGIGFLFVRYITTPEIFSVAFLWDTSKLGDIMIRFNPINEENSEILAIFFISVLSILNNNIFRYEEKRSIFNAYIILNLLSICLLISAENFVQLISAVFISDILGYLILKDAELSHKYVIYNFIADMCLFMIFALICGQTQSLSIQNLQNSYMTYSDGDFIGFVTMIALLIKMGAFLFQGYLLEISQSRFQRVFSIFLLTSPLSSILLLIKMNKLLELSTFSLLYFPIFCILTCILGIIGFVVINDIKKKIVYLNMSLMALLCIMLVLNDFAWISDFSFYFIGIFLLNTIFFQIYLYQNREENVENMLNSQEFNTLPLKASLFLLILNINLLLTIIYKIATILDDYQILFAGAVIVLAIAVVLSHIYKSPKNRRLDYLNPNLLRFFSFITNGCFLILGSLYLKAYQWQNLAVILFFISFMSFPIIASTRKVYQIKILQELFSQDKVFKYSLIMPLKYVSRTLWIVFDFIFSEKMITRFFHLLYKICIVIFLKISIKSLWLDIIYILLGFLIFWLSFHKGGIL